jgi:formylglycine-generating enzyme required for sulfatase activity
MPSSDFLDFSRTTLWQHTWQRLLGLVALLLTGSVWAADVPEQPRSDKEPTAPSMAAQLDRSAQPAGPSFGRPCAVPDLGLEMVWIKAGNFIMGSPRLEIGRYDDEGPRTRVTLTKGYWLGRYEVTQGEWQALMGSNPSCFKNAGARAPVEQVAWDDAMEFCRKLTERERGAGRLPAGYEYTLPTEAQWEYACRAGTVGPYSGKAAFGDLGWFDQNSGETTHPVGQKRPNAWGLCDMHGNVWEWCRDWYGSYPVGSVRDPAGPATGVHRVNRGGGWRNCVENGRSANRDGDEPGFRFYTLGFRLALFSIQ